MLPSWGVSSAPSLVHLSVRNAEDGADEHGTHEAEPDENRDSGVGRESEMEAQPTAQSGQKNDRDDREHNSSNRAIAIFNITYSI